MYERNLFFSDYIPFEIIEKPQVSITFHLYEYRSKLGTPMIRWLLNIDMSICGPIPCRGTISDGEVITAREDQRGLQQLGTGSHRDETSDGFRRTVARLPRTKLEVSHGWDDKTKDDWFTHDWLYCYTASRIMLKPTCLLGCLPKGALQLYCFFVMWECRPRSPESKIV